MNYKIENFGRQSEFASFLPGIAGLRGIPIWCYYVNRGQGVVSFGAEHKDHAIMEFFPAHMAYQNVKRTGFRTFLRKNGTFIEPFSDEEKDTFMKIGMNSLSIRELDKEHKLITDVNYYTLPEETVGALIRKVEITNTGEDCELEILDGMPNLIPYGISQENMKNMTQTAKAWMQVEDHKEGNAYYRVRASIVDSAEVTEVAEGNFAMAVDEMGNRLKIHVDPESVFAYDLSLGYPVRFAKGGLEAVGAEEENTSNLLPMAFFEKKVYLKKGETTCIYEVIGQVASKDILDQFAQTITKSRYFAKKIERALTLVEELTSVISTKTGSKEFDAYAKYTYMDNVLRGGQPMQLVKNKIFYTYSRKHGDLERDYNYFSMLPEYYSQGNGNFRDVNQNRRCDTFFSPFVERHNIHAFYSLIQLDGYNPLGIEKMTYEHPEVEGSFTPGKLYRILEEKYEADQVEQVFERIMEEASGGVSANFLEGYWSDHWDYNMDLIEEYLSVYPDKEQEMLYEKAYTYFLSQANINPRKKRYAKTPNGIRQYYALNKETERKTQIRQVMVNGEVYVTTLMEKLLLLCTLKTAALDPYGMGIEMEGGKPGWYDALNGLPGMLGSSMAETFELKRMLSYCQHALMTYKEPIEIMEELYRLMQNAKAAIEHHMEDIQNKDCLLDYWNEMNDVKEKYREQTYVGISGDKHSVSSEEALGLINAFMMVVDAGINKAKAVNGSVPPTYFYYDVLAYEEDEEGICPTAFKLQKMPNFLEGAVRYLKVDIAKEEKEHIYQMIKASDLYDEKLSMYKVNAALEKASFEIGRCRAFTKGWLENESIWLHMEYKYLLEVLKSELYQQFFKDFKKAAIPFLDSSVYGRSILENSSFIVSSENPNKKLHGKGFVARLSGSTVEFLSIWRIMMFGQQIFADTDSGLKLELSPAIPAYLIPEEKEIEVVFMGKTIVQYCLASEKDYIPGEYQLKGYQLEYEDGRQLYVDGPALVGQIALDVRGQKVSKIKVVME